MTPQEIQEHINNDTFFDILEQHMEVKTTRNENDQFQMEIKFPEWYHTRISEESKREIEALIRENLRRMSIQ